MAVSYKVLRESSYIPASQTTVYTAGSSTSPLTTSIDKTTVTNVTATNQSFSLSIVPAGIVPTDEHIVIQNKTIASGETYTCPEVTGQILRNGGFVSVVATAANSITLRMSGREVT